MLALITMERPGSFSAEDLRQEKVSLYSIFILVIVLRWLQARVLRLVPPLDIKNTILGQYTKSEDGEKPGYKDDETVPKDSRCATFCVTVAHVKNARWEGVPFVLKAGKGKKLPNQSFTSSKTKTLTYYSPQGVQDGDPYPIERHHCRYARRHNAQ